MNFLLSEDSYEKMKKQLDKLDLYYGDFFKCLRSREGKYDLIYTSNIFDSKKYWPEKTDDISMLKSKLSEDGKILVVTQGQIDKTVDLLQSRGFEVENIEENIFWY